MIKLISNENLHNLCNDAKQSTRHRSNLNVHETHDASVQRLFIATEPETYIRPHRHSQSHKWEFFTVLEGEMDLLIFDNDGNIIQRTNMSRETVRSVEIPANIWHSYICKKPGTIALEIKEGAYIPTSVEDFYPFSPAENTAETHAYLDWMRSASTV